MNAVAVPAGFGDVPPLSDSLQAAFWDDPVMGWMFPDQASRSRRLAKLFSTLLTVHYLSMRTVWTTSDHLGGALWAPPGHWRLTNGDMARMAPSLMFVLGRRAMPAMRFMNEVDRHHPSEPHWYLGVVGTNPAHQGKGIGSTLLRPVLDRCDQEGVPAYLESSKESNVPFYQRHGFKVTAEVSAPGGPTVWAMWRDPAGFE